MIMITTRLNNPRTRPKMYAFKLSIPGKVRFDKLVFARSFRCRNRSINSLIVHSDRDSV